MRNVNIEDKEYKCPESWNEITVDRFISFMDLIGDMNTEEITIEDQGVIVKYWFDLEDELLEQMNVENVATLFSLVSWTLYQPEEKTLESFEYAGVKYTAIKSMKDFNGGLVPLRYASWGEWKDLNILYEQAEKSSKGQWEAIKKMMAVAYQSNKTNYKKRVSLFGGVSMDVAWSCFFFIMQQTLISLKSTQQMVEAEKQKNEAIGIG